MREGKEKKFKRQRITALRKGQNIFKSNGISEIKVTQIESIIKTDENSNEYESFEETLVCLEIPIKSTGVSELIDTFHDKAPIPPTINKLIEPDSELGKELGLTKKNAVRVYDFTDTAYLKAKEEHNSKLGIAIVMKGLDIVLEDDQGNPIESDDEKIKMLKDMGLSGEQFSKLVEDITSLTKWSEKEKERFFV